MITDYKCRILLLSALDVVFVALFVVAFELVGENPHSPSQAILGCSQAALRLVARRTPVTGDVLLKAVFFGGGVLRGFSAKICLAGVRGGRRGRRMGP